MRLPQTGGCQCGRLRYEITRAPPIVYLCHCTNCQRFTSSAFSVGMIVDTEGFHLTGEPRALLHKANGNTITRWVCPDCSSWICGGPKPGSHNPNAFRTMRAGTLDDTSWLRPTMHFWTRSKQSWVVLPDERSEVFETQPDGVAGLYNSAVLDARRGSASAASRLPA